MKKLAIVALALLLSACASVKKIETEPVTVGQRLTLKPGQAWNHLDFPGFQPAQSWTLDGLWIDEMLIYSGIRDGQAIHPETGGKTRNFVFRSAMPTEEIVALFEGTVTRDQSSFQLIKVEPWTFAGRNGFRFEFERVRKSDSVQQRGLGYGAVDRGELFALVYIAPRLSFFDRNLPAFEAVVRSAQIR